MKILKSPVAAILLACALNTVSGIGIFHARQTDPEFSVLVGVLLRIVASLTCFAIPFMWDRRLPILHSWQRGRHLWMWGIFGLFTLSSYYYAVTMVGAGLANVFNAGSGVLIAGLAPLLTNQRGEIVHQIGAAGCLIGMFLLSPVSLGTGTSAFGIVLAISSGLFSALAYIMVAKTGRRHSAETVLFHWTVTNLVVIGGIALSISLAWPKSPYTWLVLSSSALLMAWSQYLTATAYQRGDAAALACLTFCGPLLSLFVDLALFNLPFSRIASVGAALIIIFGLIIPVVYVQKTDRQKNTSST